MTLNRHLITIRRSHERFPLVLSTHGFWQKGNDKYPPFQSHKQAVFLPARFSELLFIPPDPRNS